MSAGIRSRRTAAGCRHFRMPATCSQSPTSIISRKVDADPKDGPAEFGTFRECVCPDTRGMAAPISSAAAPYRLNEFHRDRLGAGPFRPATCSSSSRARRKRARPSSAMSGIIFCRSTIRTGISRKNSDAAQARASRRKVLDYCAVERRAGVSGSCRLAVCGPYRGNARRLPAEFQTVIGQKP